MLKAIIISNVHDPKRNNHAGDVVLAPTAEVITIAPTVTTEAASDTEIIVETEAATAPDIPGTSELSQVPAKKKHKNKLSLSQKFMTILDFLGGASWALIARAIGLAALMAVQIVLKATVLIALGAVLGVFAVAMGVVNALMSRKAALERNAAEKEYKKLAEQKEEIARNLEQRINAWHEQYAKTRYRFNVEKDDYKSYVRVLDSIEKRLRNDIQVWEDKYELLKGKKHPHLVIPENRPADIINFKQHEPAAGQQQKLVTLKSKWRNFFDGFKTFANTFGLLVGLGLTVISAFSLPVSLPILVTAGGILALVALSTALISYRSEKAQAKRIDHYSKRFIASSEKADKYNILLAKTDLITSLQNHVLHLKHLVNSENTNLLYEKTLREHQEKLQTLESELAEYKASPAKAEEPVYSQGELLGRHGAFAHAAQDKKAAQQEKLPHEAQMSEETPKRKEIDLDKINTGNPPEHGATAAHLFARV